MSFLGPLVPLFWISGDVSSGFQSQSGFCLIHYFCGGKCNVHSPITFYLDLQSFMQSHQTVKSLNFNQTTYHPSLSSNFFFCPPSSLVLGACLQEPCPVLRSSGWTGPTIKSHISS